MGEGGRGKAEPRGSDGKPGERKEGEAERRSGPGRDGLKVGE